MICKNCGHEMLNRKQYFGDCVSCMQPIWKWKHKHPINFSSIKCPCGCVNPEPETQKEPEKEEAKGGVKMIEESEEEPIKETLRQIFQDGVKAERLRILKEFKDFENADEIKTSQGKHNLWTPADIAVYNICKEIVENKKEPEKEEKK